MTAAIRLVDAGSVSWLRSQTIYHGLAHAHAARVARVDRPEPTPDTIVLATPREPYVCIGLHQDLEREVDVAFCREQGLPIVRRETGGGAVYLDSDQLFVQWVMSPSSLPARVERRFELFARPLVDTYRRLGIRARLRPPNDVHVDGRKIVGTGAARIGGAEVLVGNFLLDLDAARMARVLNAPSRAFRDHVDRGLAEYMTSVRRELGAAPDRAEVAALYVASCERVLGARLRPGELTADEVAAIERSDARLGSRDFLTRHGGLRPYGPCGVKIHEDVRVVEAVEDTEAGRIRVTARLHADRIDDVTLAWDPSSGTNGSPSAGHVGLEAALRGARLRPDEVERAVREYHRGDHATAGVPVDAWVRAVLALGRALPPAGRPDVRVTASSQEPQT